MVCLPGQPCPLEVPGAPSCELPLRSQDLRLRGQEPSAAVCPQSALSELALCLGSGLLDPVLVAAASGECHPPTQGPGDFPGRLWGQGGSAG